MHLDQKLRFIQIQSGIWDIVSLFHGNAGTVLWLVVLLLPIINSFQGVASSWLMSQPFVSAIG